MNLIITDCFDSKFTALDHVCRGTFGLNKYEIFQKKTDSFPAPLSTKEMENALAKRIASIQSFFESPDFPRKVEEKDVVYFCSLQKGFVQINKGWMLTAFATFRKQHGVWFTGAAESAAIKKDLWQFVELSDKERYPKFYEVDQMLEFQPLIYYTNGKTETDWFKEAFRNCASQAQNS